MAGARSAGADDIQVRIGVTLQGVEKASAVAGTALRRSTRAKQEAQLAVVKADQAATRVLSAQKELARTFGRFVLAGALTEGIEELIPNVNHNAMAALRGLGTNVAYNSLFLGFKAGPIVGILLSAMQTVNLGIQELKKAAEMEKERLNRFGELLKAKFERFEDDLQKIRESSAENVRRIRDRNYQFFRQNVGP